MCLFISTTYISPTITHATPCSTLSQAQETALLHAFLIGNSGVRILFSLSHLHYDRKDALRGEHSSEYRPQREQDGLRDACYKPFEEIPEHFPSSTYLQIVG